MRHCPRCQCEGIRYSLLAADDGTLYCASCGTKWEVGPLNQLISTNTDEL